MTAFVLMKAMPPTKGHLRLVEFASKLAPHVKVIVDTLADEPMVDVRITTLREAFKRLPNVELVHITEEISPDPMSEGFWSKWERIMKDAGAMPGDLVVGSEQYCLTVAELFGGKFYPYDPDREIWPIKATDIRRDPARFFRFILPEFQHYLIQTVTFFGAESTGKTTLSKLLAKSMDGWWVMEWARPYLEMNDAPPITTEVMTDIWHGQRALQDHAQTFRDRPWIFQDTDLFSTVGYWDFWDMNTPQGLKDNALARKSDLYIITQSNIPFEQDPIRYGGDKRESDDKFWIDLADRYQLNYRVLESSDKIDRVHECQEILKDHLVKRVNDRLAYTRFDEEPEEFDLIKSWSKGLTKVG